MVPNPTVESTDIIEDPAGVSVKTFVLPGIVNIPSIKSRSLKPMNKDIL